MLYIPKDKTPVFFKVLMTFLSHPTILKNWCQIAVIELLLTTTEITARNDIWSTRSQSYQHYLRFYSKVVWWLQVVNFSNVLNDNGRKIRCIRGSTVFENLSGNFHRFFFPIRLRIFMKRRPKIIRLFLTSFFSILTKGLKKSACLVLRPTLTSIGIRQKSTFQSSLPLHQNCYLCT